MARIVLVLVCGALVFVLVSKFAPRFLETYIPAANSESTKETPEGTDSGKAASAKKKATAPTTKSGTTVSSSAAPLASTTTGSVKTAAPSGGTVPSAPIPGVPLRPVARVTAENATLYLTNTTVGPVVGRLTKGAVVEPVFVVSSAGQNWTFVSANDQEVAGFLRSETLAKTKPAEQSSR